MIHIPISFTQEICVVITRAPIRLQSNSFNLRSAELCKESAKEYHVTVTRKSRFCRSYARERPEKESSREKREDERA